MRNAIEITATALKCDACGHIVGDVPIGPQNIGRPCPICGANLLTRDDYIAALRSLAKIAEINAAIGPVDSGRPGKSFRINPRTNHPA
jgi:predicted RNA-binding Zn-ribbon protein involved in translation (DUF1610 family)